MSYNTRRSGSNTNYNNGMGAGGGRGRPGLQQSFVSSGQYQSQKPGPTAVRPPLPQQQAQVRPQQQYTTTPLRQPAVTPLPPAPLKSALKKEVKVEASPIVAQVQQKPQQTGQPAQKANPVSVQSVQQIVPPQQTLQQSLQQQNAELEQNLLSGSLLQTQNPAVPPTLILKEEGMETENGEVKKKTIILKGKITKKEKRGRRNRRLRKILVPKNALMVLNELVGGHKFTFLDKDPSQPDNYVEPDTYIASVTIEGTEHVGYGKSKTAAKTSAAENALRHIILSKISSPLGPAQSTTSVDSEGDTSMEVDGEKQEEEDVSWLHVASFAMHKLFSSWYAEGDDKLEQVGAKFLAKTGVSEMAAKLQEIKPFPGPPKTRKPAKALPANPELLNPVMLLNQMRDDVTYEEHSKTGSAPHITFVMKTTVEGQDFFGKGGNKKIARKNCAYAACTKLYEINYPTEEFDPNAVTDVDMKPVIEPMF